MTDSEMLDKALDILINMEFDYICDEMFDYGWCEGCTFDHPVKECWRAYLSGEYRKGKE